MKPADMKLSMASAGTLLSFTSHWSSGTYSTWSSTNWTHTNRRQHFFSVRIFLYKRWGYFLYVTLIPLHQSPWRTLQLAGRLPSGYLTDSQDSSIISPAQLKEQQRQPHSDRRGRFPLVYLQEACGGVDCQVTIWCNQTQSVVQQSFFYESANSGCSGADDDN